MRRPILSMAFILAPPMPIGAWLAHMQFPGAFVALLGAVWAAYAVAHLATRHDSPAVLDYKRRLGL